jgi:hypothetical protein
VPRDGEEERAEARLLAEGVLRTHAGEHRLLDEVLDRLGRLVPEEAIEGGEVPVEERCPSAVVAGGPALEELDVRPLHARDATIDGAWAASRQRAFERA